MINVAPYDIDGDGMPELALAYEFANVAKNSQACWRFSSSRTALGRRKEIDRFRHRTGSAGPTCLATGKKVLVNQS